MGCGGEAPAQLGWWSGGEQATQGTRAPCSAPRHLRRSSNRTCAQRALQAPPPPTTLCSPPQVRGWLRRPPRRRSAAIHSVVGLEKQRGRLQAEGWTQRSGGGTTLVTLGGWPAPGGELDGVLKQWQRDRAPPALRVKLAPRPCSWCQGTGQCGCARPAHARRAACEKQRSAAWILRSAAIH